MNKIETQNVLKSELKNLTNAEIAQIQSLLVKLAIIEFDNYKEAA
jgi:hypothetical protein